MNNARIFMGSFVFLLLVLTVAWPAFGGNTKTLEYLLEVNIPAPSLQNNRLEEKLEQTCYIYLPPSYYKNITKRYPVAYFLNGFEDSPDIVRQFQISLNTQISEKKLSEMIVVGVNGINKLRGCFYVNSPVIGNWEDFVVSDVIRYMDGNYRTIAEPRARGLAGFSMGGFGALNLGLKHPEIYGVIFAASPGIFDPKGLGKAMEQWDLVVRSAYGAAFAPNLKLKYPYADIPEMNGTPADNAIVALWENGYGNLTGKVNEYLKKKERLNAIKIIYGTNDYYPWIPEGCRYLSQLLSNAKVGHEIKESTGEHIFTFLEWEEEMFPFFAAHLKTEDQVK